MPGYRTAIDTCTDLASVEVERLIGIFNTEGFIVADVMRGAGPKAELKALSRIFGTAIPHDRGDADGIAPIAVVPGYDGYLGASNQTHYLHTDGTFNAIAPMTAILYCERTSPDGGVSQVVHARRLHEYLATTDPEALAALYAPDAMTVRRAGKSATRPVFSRHGSLKRIAFRYDTVASIEIAPKAARGFALIRKFIEDPATITEFRLEPHQIFVTDNTAVLHGRTAFPVDSPRLLWRMNTDGRSPYADRLEFGFVA